MSFSNNISKLISHYFTWSDADVNIISKGITDELFPIPTSSKPVMQKIAKDVETQSLERKAPVETPPPEPRTSLNRSPKSDVVISELRELFEEGSFTGKIAKRHGPRALMRYLNRPQKYIIAKISATWIFPSALNLHGHLGYHACIRLPGNRICELGIADIPWEQQAGRLSDQEVRFATGKQFA